VASIEKLTSRLLAKDQSAVYEFAEVRRNRLLAYIEGQLGQHLWGKVDAQDVYQEAVLAGWHYLPTTDLTNCNPSVPLDYGVPGEPGPRGPWVRVG
jgi:DNA-directed RNA polymerase specialized sigma24 family protein